MHMLTNTDRSMPYIRNTEYIDETLSTDSVVDALKRKISPEKQALSEEELRKLVDNDELHLSSLNETEQNTSQLFRR